MNDNVTSPEGNPTVNPPATPPTTPPTTTTDWTTGFNDDDKGYVQNKGFKDPSALLSSYRNLEKLHGVPAERILKLPENLEDPGFQSDMFKRLGRPDAADGYRLDGVDDKADPEFVQFAKKTFHDLGFTNKQANGLLKMMQEYDEKVGKQEADEYATKQTQAKDALVKEWGPEYDRRTQATQHAARVFGVKDEQFIKIQEAMGYADAMKFMYTIGSKLGEAKFIEGKGPDGAVTMEGARAQIKALIRDTEFQKKINAKDVEAKRKWDELHVIAYPTASN